MSVNEDDETTMQTTVKFITTKERKTMHVGSLMFPGYYYDCGHNVDKKHLKKQFAKELEGKRIMGVLIHTEDSSEFKNIQNKSIQYKTRMIGCEKMDGAYRARLEETDRYFWWTDHPVGDAIIVYSEIKKKSKA